MSERIWGPYPSLEHAQAKALAIAAMLPPSLNVRRHARVELDADGRHIVISTDTPIGDET